MSKQITSSPPITRESSEMSETLKYLFKTFRFCMNQAPLNDTTLISSSENDTTASDPNESSLIGDESSLTPQTTFSTTMESTIMDSTIMDTASNPNSTREQTFHSALADLTTSRLSSTFSISEFNSSTPIPAMKNVVSRADLKLVNVGGEGGQARESIMRRISSRRSSQSSLSRSSLGRWSSFGMEGRPLNKILATPPTISRQRFKERRCLPPSQIPKPAAPRKIKDIAESLGDTVLVVEPKTEAASRLKSRIPKLASATPRNLGNFDNTATIGINPTPALKVKGAGGSRQYSPWALVSVRPFRMVRKSIMVRHRAVCELPM